MNPRWLTAGEVILINQAEVAETGEPHLLLDRGLLESAVAKPQTYLAYGEPEQRDIVYLAVTLLVGLAMDHPFENGNKRTAQTAAIMFLDLNGYEWVAPNDEAPSDALYSYIEDRNVDALHDFFGRSIRRNEQGLSLYVRLKQQADDFSD